ADILADSESQLRFRCLEFLGLDQIAQHNCMVFLIGNFDTHRGLARYRRFDTDIGSRQIQLDIIRQIDDAADFHAHFRLQFIPGNRRTAAYVGHSDVHAEIMKCFLKFLRGFPKMRVGISLTLSAPSLQELQRREIVFPLRLLFLSTDLMLDIPDTALDLLLGRTGFFRWDAAAASSPADSGEPSAVPETSATS